MTTVKESTNGHRALPPPSSVENPAELNSADLPTNKANNNQFANDDQVVGRQKDVSSRESHGDQELSRATKSTPLLAHEKVNAYHVPPERYAPKPDFRRQELPSVEIDSAPLPERCQFMFSDGRQCTMARSDIHPSLCRFHSEREDQLFGDPVAGGMVVGAALDLPELYSACRDLTTAAGVNRALAQVFRLLAQRRISRQEAATFGHLAQLLLRTISAMRAESTDPASPPRKGYQRDALFAGNEVVPSEYHERGASPALPPHDKVVSASDSPKAVPPSPIDAADVPQTWVMRSPVAVEQRMSPPNSQASRNEHFRKSDSQALQNQQIQNLGT
jgi:hypothetical protein